MVVNLAVLIVSGLLDVDYFSGELEWTGMATDGAAVVEGRAGIVGISE